MDLLKLLYKNQNDEVIELAKEFGWVSYKDDKLTKSIERIEFEKKLESLDIKQPW